MTDRADTKTEFGEEEEQVEDGEAAVKRGGMKRRTVIERKQHQKIITVRCRKRSKISQRILVLRWSLHEIRECR